MKPATAIKILWFVLSLSLAGSAWILLHLVGTALKLGDRQAAVSYDTADPMMLYCVMVAVATGGALTGARGINNWFTRKYGGIVVVLFFMVIPVRFVYNHYLLNFSDQIGYERCSDPRSVSRVIPGKAYILSLPGCEER